MVFAELTRYSGENIKQTVIINQKPDFAEFSVNCPEGGSYGISFTARVAKNAGDYKINFLAVNGEVLGELFVYSSEFMQTIFPKANFKKGRNIIRVDSYWGYLEIKTVELIKAKDLPPDIYSPNLGV